MKLLVWMNAPSPYQAAFFEELNAIQGVRLRVVYRNEIPDARRELGWSQLPTCSYSTATLRPGWRGVLEAMWLALSARSDAHLINGLWAVPAFAAAAVLLLVTGQAVFFHAELPDPRQRRSRVLIMMRNLVTTMFLWRAKGIFAVSSKAVTFYREFVRTTPIFEFAYFSAFTGPPYGASRNEVLFLGQLIDRKGLYCLLKAFETLKRPGLRLSIAGAGPIGGALRRAAIEQGLGDIVDILPPVPSSSVSSRIRLARLAVLPSLFDGWGLVVNEALLAGVPVVVSDQAGASDLITNADDGAVFKANDHKGLAAAMEGILASDVQRGPNVTAWAGKIGPTSGARYFVEAVQYGLGRSSVFPHAPWRAA